MSNFIQILVTALAVGTGVYIARVSGALTDSSNIISLATYVAPPLSIFFWFMYSARPQKIYCNGFYAATIITSIASALFLYSSIKQSSALAPFIGAVFLGNFVSLYFFEKNKKNTTRGI